MNQTMNCKLVMDFVELYKEGIDSPESHTAIHAHLRSCPNCRRYYHAYDGIRRRNIRSQATLLEMENMQEKGYASLSRRLRHRRRMRIAGTSVAVGVGSIMLLTGIFLSLHRPEIRQGTH